MKALLKGSIEALLRLFCSIKALSTGAQLASRVKELEEALERAEVRVRKKEGNEKKKWKKIGP